MEPISFKPLPLVPVIDMEKATPKEKHYFGEPSFVLVCVYYRNDTGMKCLLTSDVYDYVEYMQGLKYDIQREFDSDMHRGVYSYDTHLEADHFYTMEELERYMRRAYC